MRECNWLEEEANKELKKKWEDFMGQPAVTCSVAQWTRQQRKPLHKLGLA